jgi:hypothetical protein
MELQTLTNDIAAARARLAAARATKDVGKARGLEEEIARAESQRDRLLAHITTNLVAAPDPAPVKRGRKDEPAAEPTLEPTAPVAAAATSDAATSEAATSDVAAVEPPPVVSEVEAAPVVAAAEPPPVAEVEASPPDDATPDAAAQEAEAAPEATAETGLEQPSPDTAERDVAIGAAPPAPAPMAASADGDTNMWDQLKPSDIERAKQDLATRRDDMLARHAEELRTLEADQAQLEVLEQAIAAFLQKFISPAGSGVVKLDQERELRQTAG